MFPQPRTERKTSSNSCRERESGTAMTRMTIGLTLRRTARRINRLKGARALIPSHYLPPSRPDPRVAAALHQRDGLRMPTQEVSSAGESHPDALSEPYLNLSAHTAPARG